jgi:hypothetical protein
MTGYRSRSERWEAPTLGADAAPRRPSIEVDARCVTVWGHGMPVTNTTMALLPTDDLRTGLSLAPVLGLMLVVRLLVGLTCVSSHARVMEPSAVWECP